MAAKAIVGLQATEKCYDDAIDILSSRFEDKRLIVEEHLRRLRELPDVTHSNDAQGLKTWYDSVQCYIRGLKSLNISLATYATVITNILLRALPTDIVIGYHRDQASGTSASYEADTL